MSAADEAISTQDLIARRSRLLGPAYRLFYDQPVQFVRGEGVWLYDAAGHRYLDAYNNVASVGHCHPHVVQAIARQAAVLNTHTRYLHETVLDLRGKTARAPFRPRSVTSCSPAPAARPTTSLCASREPAPAAPASSSPQTPITASPARWPSCLPRSDCRCRKEATCGWCRRRASAGDDAGEIFAASRSRRARRHEEERHPPGGASGRYHLFQRRRVRRPARLSAPRGRSRRVRTARCSSPTRCSPASAAAASRCGALPATASSPISSPWASRWATAIRSPGWRRVRSCWRSLAARSRYFNTFGGNPVSAAAGIAVLDVIESEGLMQNAQRTGGYLRQAAHGSCRRGIH